VDKKTAIQRANIIKNIRNFFDNQNFIEVETPIMVNIPGMEPYLTPFETTLSSSQNKDYKFFLNTSPELQMKKLLSKDFQKIYNITKVFRNGETHSITHNPEFTMLEWYRQNSDYKNLMQDTENLIQSLHQKKYLKYQENKIDISVPFKRVSVKELFIEYTNIDLEKNQDFNDLKNKAEKLELSTKACKNWDDIFFLIFLNKIELNLGKEKATFVYDYPISQAALAKKKNSLWAERFELYIGGIELCNAFSELINSKEQKDRLIEEQNLRKTLKKTIIQIDEEFIESLNKIKKPCSGNALGIDRLIMLLLNKKSIEEIIFFPISNMIN